MSEQPGKPYENLTQVIFQAILGQKEFPNLVVEHDVILQGKTGRHQIDVYWKFEHGGVPHEVIVQAKDWQKPVDQSHPAIGCLGRGVAKKLNSFFMNHLLREESR